MKPSVGRIVHFRDSGRDMAAIVTEILDGGNISLAVFNPRFGAVLWRSLVPLDESETPVDGSWHWPPRVDG